MMKYFKYSLRLEEPLRIADDSSAKQGQTTTRRYIPGSTIRGYVISRLASGEFKEIFTEIKKDLFSDHVRFHNAYPSIVSGDKEQLLLPSPMGFYEDKQDTDGEKELQNVVIGGIFDESLKRAKLGAFISIEKSSGIVSAGTAAEENTSADNAFEEKTAEQAEGGTALRMSFYTPRTGSETRIRLGKKSAQDVFRSTAVQAGYCYTGYIALDETSPDDENVSSRADLAGAIGKILQGTAVLGNARTSGYGKCSFFNCGLTEEMPYASLAAKAGTDDLKNECYMMLLSDTVMRNGLGEYCGLYLPALEKALGVKDLRILYCSTAVSDARGFNRNYGGATPSVSMYEKGSVFHLTYRGSIDQTHLDAVQRGGIGVKRNEGYGQVLFISGYENLRYKKKGTANLLTSGVSAPAAGQVSQTHTEDADVIQAAAKAHYKNLIQTAMWEYVVSHPLKQRHTASQLGNILSIAIQNRFTPDKGWENIRRYFDHKMKKEDSQRVHTADSKAYGAPLYRNVIEVIHKTPLDELLHLTFKAPEKTIMGLPAEHLLNPEEVQRVRLELLIQLIRYDFKKEVKA